MLNILLIEKDIEYGKKLVNKLAASNKLFRLAGMVDTLKEVKDTLNHQEIDVILFDIYILDYNNLIYKYLLNNINKEKVVLILEKIDLKKLPTVKYFLKNTNINKNIELINSILLIRNSLLLNYPNNSNEVLIKLKIKNELINIGYNMEHLGTKYILESVYILYALEDYCDNNLNRDIYPIIAKKYGKSTNNIKCNIRNATNIMYFENEEEKLKKYFNRNDISKVSSRTVIFIILNKIKKQVREL